jgi:hypothetical protein
LGPDVLGLHDHCPAWITRVADRLPHEAGRRERDRLGAAVSSFFSYPFLSTADKRDKIDHLDRRVNPYTPNAGARPPALVGRDAELEGFEILLDRLKQGRSEQSMLITGLRGVGKTVLLGAFESRALNSGWVTAPAEITKNQEFGPRMGHLVRRSLFQVGPKASWGDRMRRAAGVLKSFSLTVSSDGSVTAGIDADPVEGIADTGNLSDDLTDLLVALGEAARERETGVAFLIDEVQFLRSAEFEALIAALHRTVQQLPITLVGAGLPQLPRLAGEASHTPSVSSSSRESAGCRPRRPRLR